MANRAPIEEFPFEAVFLAARASRNLLALEPGRWVLQLRKSMGMPQRELAQRSGLRQAYISEIESGKADPRLSTLRRLAEGLYCGLLILPKTGVDFDERRAERTGVGAE